jgi:hypothetical protein
MALTNIASVGFSPKRRIISERGLTGLESCQFSDNTMIRRHVRVCLGRTTARVM